MSTSHTRGHKIYFDWSMMIWLYCDNDEPISTERPCKRCRKFPTPGGYDACLGYINGAVSACCGHGVDREFIIYEN